jgi:hypothetical protein
MKTLPFDRDEKKNRVVVACADGYVSVYSHCAYCIHCRGIQIGNQVIPSPQVQALKNFRKGIAGGGDEKLMNAAMMFNTLIRDGTAIECDDDANEGFRKMY